MKNKTLFGMLTWASLATAQMAGPADASLLFEASGPGSLVIVPVSATVLHETITMAFTTTAGAPLDAGVLSTDIDLTAPDITSTLFNAHFSLTGPGGAGLFGTYGLTSSVFSTPVNETFAGKFTVTSGSGFYADYTGSGTFSGTNVYSDPSLPSAVTEMSVSGLLDVPEPSTIALLGFAVAGLAARKARHRAA
jgi:hypothetical protein